MNIGFDGSRSFLDKKTGTENYSYQLLKNLSLIDQSNNYYIFIRPNTTVKKTDWPANFHFVTIPYPRLWTQLGLAHQTFKSPKIDLLFVPSHTLPIVRKPGLKTVITVHDLGAEFLPQTHQLKQRLYLKMMTYHQLKSATHIIAVSQATKDDIVRKVGIDPSKITVTYEGFDKDFYTPQKSDELLTVLNKYDLQKDLYFLFVGTIQPRKNLTRLIEAYYSFLKIDGSGLLAGGRREGHPLSARSDEGMRTSSGGKAGQDPQKLPKLVLAGSKGWMSDEIYQLPTKLGIEQSVKFLGYTPLEELPALYSGARAFLFPSLFEGFGLPILEAMACGCPVLTSNVSSMPEVGRKAALYVNPNSVDEIAEGIYKLYQTDKLRDQMRQSGFEQVKQFSWQKCAKQTLRIFEEITSPNRLS